MHSAVELQSVDKPLFQFLFISRTEENAMEMNTSLLLPDIIAGGHCSPKSAAALTAIKMVVVSDLNSHGLFLQ